MPTLTVELEYDGTLVPTAYKGNGTTPIFSEEVWQTACRRSKELRESPEWHIADSGGGGKTLSSKINDIFDQYSGI